MAFQPTQAPISPPRLGNILETSHLCSLCGFVVLEGAEQTLFSMNGGFFFNLSAGSVKDRNKELVFISQN